MIIGQGQLDSILNSSSENRRAVIEEAAGVLKHRRRKERAERRLVATQENLERLGDLVREVRRQMRPLERQAVSARSYSDVEHDLRQARRALFSTRLTSFERRRRELDQELQGSSSRERALRSELVTLDAQATTAAAEMASRREEMLASTLGTLQGLSERARGTVSIIQERERSLRMALIASADENVIATLEADAAKLEVDLRDLEGEESQLGLARAQLDDERRALALAEEEFAATWGSVSSDADEAALKEARGRVALLERSLRSLHDSERRCLNRSTDTTERRDDALARRDESLNARRDAVVALEGAQRERGDAQADAQYAEGERDDADEALREATDVAARTQARAEALTRALDELSGAGGRAIVGALDGVLGSFLDLIEVDAGWERAVESAAGASVGAMVVDGRKSARAALEALRREGGAGLILPVAEGVVESSSTPAGCTPLRSLVRARSAAPAHVTRVLDALFRRAFVAPDWESGIEAAVVNPDLVIVTREGDRFAASGWRVASGRAVVTRSTVEEAQRAASDAGESVGPIRERRRVADEAAVLARQRLNRSSTQLARAQAELERLDRDVDRSGELVEQLEHARALLTSELEELTGQITSIDAELQRAS